jgi:hypothetical protein
MEVGIQERHPDILEVRQAAILEARLILLRISKMNNQVWLFSLVTDQRAFGKT